MLLKTLQEFLDYYGTNSTTNFQLIEYAKELNIPNFYCLMRDELSDIPKTENPVNVIINLHSSDQKGIHWSALAKFDNSTFFFDSYGLPPTKEVENFLSIGELCLRKFFEFTGFSYNDLKLQESTESFCGQLSLYVLYKLNYESGITFNSLILNLKNELRNLRRPE